MINLTYDNLKNSTSGKLSFKKATEVTPYFPVFPQIKEQNISQIIVIFKSSRC
jgi:hypothetical protein